MKRLLILLAVVTSVTSQAQTIRANKIIADKSIYLRNAWIDSVLNDTTGWGGRTKSIPTAKSVYDFVTGRLSGAGGLQNLQSVLSNGSSITAPSNTILLNSNSLGIGNGTGTFGITPGVWQINSPVTIWDGLTQNDTIGWLIGQRSTGLVHKISKASLFSSINLETALNNGNTANNDILLEEGFNFKRYSSVASDYLPVIGFPPGGSSGQVPTKITGTDYDYQWATPSVRFNNFVSANGSGGADNGNNQQTWSWNALQGSGLIIASNGVNATGNNQRLISFLLSGANGNSNQTTYTATFSNTHTGTGANNVAAIFNASGGTNNYSALFETGKVGMGTLTPHTSSKLDIVSTTEGFLKPRMTAAQRLAISSPAEGLEVHDLDSNRAMVYRSAAWRGLAYTGEAGAGGAGITALTGDVTASGTGSVAATIAANAVTTTKIADANVTTVKIADGNITTAKIAAAAINTAKADTGRGANGLAPYAGVQKLIDSLAALGVKVNIVKGPAGYDSTAWYDQANNRLNHKAIDIRVDPSNISSANFTDDNSDSTHRWNLNNVASNDAVGLDQTWIIAISDETTSLTTGTAKVTFRVPFGCTLTGVRLSLNTVSTSGIPTIDINENGTTILSTKLTVDANEKTSVTAATPVVISDAALADDAEITIDIDVSGTGAKGGKLVMYVKKVAP